MKNFKKVYSLLTEAPIDTGEYPDFISDERRRGWEQGGPNVNQILKALPDNAQEYFEMIISKTYQRILSKLCHYLQVQPQNVNMNLVMGCMKAVGNCVEIENAHKMQLNDLAKKTVIEMDDFSFLREKFKTGQIKIYSKLMVGNLRVELERLIAELEQNGTLDQNALDEGGEGGNNPILDALDEIQNEDVPADGGLTTQEEIDKDLAEYLEREMAKDDDEVEDDEVEDNKIEDFDDGDVFEQDEKVFIKKLGDVFVQGTALDGMYVFELCRGDLQRITANPNIGVLYGCCAIAAQIGYFISGGGEGQAGQDGPHAGIVKVLEYPKGSGKYVIIALGMLFPFLVHEIIKGLTRYRFLSKHTKELQAGHDVTEETNAIVMSELQRLIRMIITHERPNILAKDIPIESLVTPIQKQITEMMVKSERDRILRGVAPVKRLELMSPEERQQWETNHQITKNEIKKMVNEMIKKYDLDFESEEDEDEDGFEAPQGYTPEEDEEDIDF